MEKDRYGQRLNAMQNDGEKKKVEIHINGVGKMEEKMERCRGVNWKREMGCAGKMSNGVKRQLRDMRGDDRERRRKSDRRREL